MPFSISKGNGSTTVLTSPAKRRVVHELMNTLCFVIFYFLKRRLNLTRTGLQVALGGFCQSAGVATRLGPLPLAVSTCHRTWRPGCPLVRVLLCGEGNEKSNTMSDANSAKVLKTLHTAMKVHQRLYRSEHKSVAGAPRQAFRNTLQSLNAAYLTS